MYTCTKFQLIWITSDFGTKFVQKIWMTKFWKKEHQNRNKNRAIYLCTKFQSIWKTSNFGTKFTQKMWLKRILKKTNIKTVYRNCMLNTVNCIYTPIYPATKFQSIWRNPDYGNQICPKSMSDKHFRKTNFKVIVSI